MKECPNPACPDRIRMGLAGEYVDSVDVCPRCGTRLITVALRHEDPAISNAPDADLRMVCVVQTADEGLASLVKSIFDGDNIRYLVRGEGLQDLLGWGRIVGGFNFVVGPAEFLVHEEDADRARLLLTDVTDATEESRDPDDDA